MNIFRLFQARSKGFYAFLICLSLISSLTNVGILLFINSAIRSVASQGMVEIQSAVAFFLLIGSSFLVSFFFQKYMVDMTNDITYGIELSILEKIRHASYESFEKLGYEKIYAAISDARILSRMPTVFINLINSFITIVCTLAYLFYTSFFSGLVLLGIMIALLAIYMYRDKHIAKNLEKVRDLQDTYYGYLRELLQGFRQVRVSLNRSHTLFDRYLFANRTESRKLNTKASRQYAFNELTGVYSWYILLGSIVFILPVFMKMDPMQIVGFVTAVLFMMSPLSQIIIFLPSYASFKIALNRINKIDSQLQVNLPLKPADPVAVQFESLRFENIKYSYDTTDPRSFHLHLSELTISKQEILFLIGGNGSGKTTFINLLMGLYQPQQGKIFIDEKEVSWEAYCRFVNNMSVVFTNQYLFRENYDQHDLSANNTLLNQMTQQFNLTGVLKVHTDENRVDTNLSRGQQKRVALLLALLEEKPIIVLDEWAAEQDTINKDAFYTEWLELLRRMGKTIVIVTHDDDYFSCADRVIKFKAGSIMNERMNDKVAN
ncbi:ATP-binding cassette domain-containing protein [Chitinophaga rhizophila]|uniref:ATP-binding cassette domain-containing protein n=1 Tax=Chitinophaga rhizophila TaxID=2866212 RepID=A0ABS7G6R9_9BACT|nr:ATP-binding cassette domain-containing protein [Chitinophaga rhizophila]MBW8683319.1 ATP-binding cassette domain-containing protein [Chitinophaga rhizophila]